MTPARQQLAITQAATLARQGNLTAAAALLTDIPDPSVDVLDLLARIRSQQKRWAEADALWARVEEVASTPGVAGTSARASSSAVDAAALAAAVAGRRTIAAIRARRRASRPVLPIAAAVVLVGAAIAGGVVATGGGADETPAQPTQQATSQPTVTRTVDTGAVERAAELARRLAVLEGQRRAAAAAMATQLEVIQRRVAGPGVVVQRGQSVVRVVFTEGVFTAGTDLSPTGQRALTGLGRRLPGLKATITVTGYSVVVPSGSSSGGSSTALLRARVATQELSTASGLPLTAFAMQSGDQAHPPYRTDAKNRTVTVTFTPVTGR